jgi:hypothetical protein
MHMNLDRRTGYVKVGSEGCALLVLGRSVGLRLLYVLRVMLSLNTLRRRRPLLLLKAQTTRNSSIRPSPWTLLSSGRQQLKGSKAGAVEEVRPRVEGQGVGAKGRWGEG